MCIRDRLVAYWVVIEHFMTGGGVMLLVAVLLGIVGTILFIRGIARLLSIVACLLYTSHPGRRTEENIGQ